MDPRALLNMDDTDVSLTDWPEEYDPSQENQEDAAWQQEVSTSGILSFDQKVAEWGKDELQSQLKIWNDPAGWSETYLSHPDDPFKQLKLKDFQKQVISDWHPNIAVRIGRQQGKCNCGNDLVHLANGTLERVEDLFKKGEQFDIIGLDERLQQVVRKAVIHDNGVKQCVKVKLRGGITTEVTTNHRLLTISKTTGLPISVFAEELQPGDYVAVPDKQITIDAQQAFTDAEVRLIGYYTAEGSLTAHSLGFTNFDQEILADFLTACSSYGEYNDRVDNSNKSHNISYPTLEGNPVRDLMRRAGLAGKHSRDKQAPAEIMRSPLAQKAIYLSCLIDCDGWIGNDKAGQGIGITLVSERLIYDIRILFLQLGIHGNISSCKKKCHNTGTVSDTWTYFIGEKEEILKAAAVLQLKAKAGKLAAVVEKLDAIKPNNNQNALPPQLQEYCKRYKYSQPKGKQLSDLPFRIFKNNYAPQKYKIKALGDIYQDQYLKDIASAPIRWRTVESVEFIGDQQTYAIEILGDLPDELRYLIVDGIWQHNSVILCARALWYCLRYPSKTFLIATPTRAQVWRLFEILTNLAHNFIQEKQIKVTRGNPMIVRFANGSKIIGFTVGTKSGRKAFGVRGQMAHYLAFDEVDHMSEGDVSTLLAIKNNLKGALHIWMSSTPTGERKQFFQICTKGKAVGFHAYHFKPMDLEGYDPVSDAQMKGLMPLEEYEHEILAEFGAISSGVFRPDYVDNAIQAYEPPFIDGVLTTHAAARYLPIKPDCVYVIGVDWNTSTVGQAITVVEWNPTKKKARIWLQEEQPNKDFSHTDAVKRIVELTKLLNAPYICVDYGFGDSDIEQLKLYDKEHPGLGLTKRLFIINFGTDIEVIDPETKLETKKDTKPYIINSAVRMFENNMIELPKFWDYKNRLVDDLRNYMILRRTETGAITYTKLNDHRLISYVLALFAISHKDNLLLPGRSGYLTKVVLKSSSIWASNTDKSISRRTFSPEDTKYFNHKVPTLNTHFNEEKYDSNALGKLKTKDATQFRHPQQTSSRTAKVHSAIPGRGLRNTSTRNRF